MNKNISLALNIVLAIAVAVLYYLHFTSKAACTADVATNDSTAAAKPVVQLPKEIKSSKIVYVNMDVLNDKYEYVKEVLAESKRKQGILQEQYRNKAKALQDRYQELQKKAEQGLLSENQQKEAEIELGKGREDLDRMEDKEQERLQGLQIENIKVYKTITDYINEYNKNSRYNYVLAYSPTTINPVLVVNDSLDITAEILEGLNAQYKAKKGK